MNDIDRMGTAPTTQERWAFEDCEDDTCPECLGEGGWHDCGEDCCCCLDKEEITETCQVCGGSGIWNPDE